MSLYEFSSQDANQNIRRTRGSRWPDGRRKNETRLSGFTDVSLSPTFKFDTSDKILTIGSCFAREIESFLATLGFTLPALDISIPREERITQTANDILNKYTVHSIESEIRWGFEDVASAPEDFFLRASEDSWHDAQMVHNLPPASLERVTERRQMVSTMMSRLPECRIIVITLGLVEAWYDTKTELFLNGMPPAYALKEEPDRFVLKVLEFEEIAASLERIHALIAKYGHPDFQMLITVSPVPFKVTLSGRDALIANTYGKSVQRAAAEVFAAHHDNVNYFPSYEIVTLADRNLAYEADNIHVTEAMVAHIMTTVIKAYAPDCALDAVATPVAAPAASRDTPTDRAGLMLEAKHNLNDRDYDAAILSLTSLLYRFSEKMTPQQQADTHLKLGVALLRSRQTAEGVKQLQMAKALTPDHPRTTYKLALGLDRLRLREDALAMFREALRLDGSVPDYHWRLGMQLLKLEQNQEALVHLRDTLALDPDHKGALEALKEHSGVGAS